jgi:hypothetical protein
MPAGRQRWSVHHTDMEQTYSRVYANGQERDYPDMD